MPDFFDRFIDDLVKGASSNLRENGGPGVNIVVSRENRGHEEKLANHMSPGTAGILGGLAGTMVGGGVGGRPGAAIGALAGPLAAAMQSDDGHGAGGAIGSVVGGPIGGIAGGAGGALLGGGLGALAGHPGAGAAIGAGVGGLAGWLKGQHALANRWGEEPSMIDKARDKLSADKVAAGFTQGLANLAGKGIGAINRNPRAGAAALGAGIGALGGAAGSESGHRMEGALKGGLIGGAGTAALGAGTNALMTAHPLDFAMGAMPKMGALEGSYTNGAKAAATAFGVKQAFLGALAGSVLGGSALKAGIGAVAPKLAPHLAKGIGAIATDAAGSMLGGHIGSKLDQPQAPG